MMSRRIARAPRWLRWLATSLACCNALACSEPPDVILIAVDTLRMDHVGAFSASSPARTPFIDELATESIAFTQAWSPISVTGPAFATVLTGQLPGRHGVLRNTFRGGMRLAQEIPTVTEHLKGAGYATAAFVSGFTLRRDVGLNRGFDVYEYPAQGVERIRGDASADRAIEWLQAQEGPVFLWYHSYDPHGPLKHLETPPADSHWRRGGSDAFHFPEYQAIDSISDPEFYARRYRAAVEFADAQAGRILAALKSTQRYHNALVIFVADHGENITERELWFDHGNYAYAEVLRVPLLVKLPGGDRGGDVVDVFVGLQDVAPTVIDALELEPHGEGGRMGRMQGHSLLRSPGYALFLGESEMCRPYAVLDCPPRGSMSKTLAARDERFTLIHRPTPRGVVLQAYDRLVDPAELRPLKNAQVPVALERSIEKLVTERSRHLLQQRTAPEKPDRLERETLRALGYVE